VDEGVACMIADDPFERNSHAQAVIMSTAGELYDMRGCLREVIE
jgi:hypothetical protein